MSGDVLRCHYCGGWNMRVKPSGVFDSAYTYCLDCDASGPLSDSPKAARDAHARVMRVPEWPTEEEIKARQQEAYQMARAAISMIGGRSVQAKHREPFLLSCGFDEALRWIKERFAVPVPAEPAEGGAK